MLLKYFCTIFVLLLCSNVIHIIVEAKAVQKNEPTDCQLQELKPRPGKCKSITVCPYAIGNLNAGIDPSLCSQNDKRIVCCPESPRISELSCEKYQEKLRNIHGSTSKAKNANATIPCPPLLYNYISGGTDAALKRYPHQVALGYGSKIKPIWRCGGTLISEDFVLTAGHCALTDSKIGSPVKVLLGDRVLSKQEDSNRLLVDVKKVIPYPNYKPPSLYDDIALVKLKQKVPFSASIFPACLPQPQERLDNRTKVEVTGWGQLGAFDGLSDVLQTVRLERISLKNCSGYFKTPTLPNGIKRSQICAGDFKGNKDTCAGDSGGPLVVNKSDKEYCLFYILGVTSFGSELCGYQTPGIYTNVINYLDWIESHVWPELETTTTSQPNTTKSPGTTDNPDSLVFVTPTPSSGSNPPTNPPTETKGPTTAPIPIKTKVPPKDDGTLFFGISSLSLPKNKTLIPPSVIQDVDNILKGIPWL